MDKFKAKSDPKNDLKNREWFSVDNHLVAVPKDKGSHHCLRVLSRFKAQKLAGIPTPEIIRQYREIVVIEKGSPNPHEDLYRRSLWMSESGVANLGIVFESLRGNIINWENLSGILYPETETFTGYTGHSGPAEMSPWLDALNAKKVWCLTRLLSPRKKAQTLESLLKPQEGTHRLGIWGIGNIGKVVASFIRVHDTSVHHIEDIFIGGSRSNGNIEVLGMELEDMNLELTHQPVVHEVPPSEEKTFFDECDTIVILAGVIPNGNSQADIDVRATQFSGNMEIVRQLIGACPAKYDGQILMGSDPVEQLTMQAYLEMRKKGIEIYTHQLAGFGGMINRSRAKAMADRLGIQGFIRSGRVFGPHGKMVTVFPTHDRDLYNERTAEILSKITGHRNYFARERNQVPYLGPAMLMAAGLMRMHYQSVKHKLLYASPFLPSQTAGSLGAFFGTRVQYNRFTKTWVPRVDELYLQAVMDVLERVHRYVEITSHNPVTLGVDPFSFTEGKEDHSAFHPYVMERWEEETQKIMLPQKKTKLKSD